MPGGEPPPRNPASADASNTNGGIDFIRYMLLAFGGVALFVGAFVIFNTISITVAQPLSVHSSEP